MRHLHRKWRRRCLDTWVLNIWLVVWTLFWIPFWMDCGLGGDIVKRASRSGRSSIKLANAIADDEVVGTRLRLPINAAQQAFVVGAWFVNACWLIVFNIGVVAEVVLLALGVEPLVAHLALLLKLAGRVRLDVVVPLVSKDAPRRCIKLASLVAVTATQLLHR